MLPVLLFIAILAFLVFVIYFYKPGKKISLPEGYQELLSAHVAFYRNLDTAGKARFENMIRELLGYVHIHGVKTEVTDLDRILIAASGVIPIFGFPDWKYYNLRDILLYPGAFDKEDFSIDASGNTIGLVGSGTMQQMMILSKPALYHGFSPASEKENTGIHEFVHLLDKEDGSVDGLPENLLGKEYTHLWLNLMAKEIEAIKNGESDLNAYGATNQAEFFAVAAEYFFTSPDMFQTHHPELYELMTKIFQQQPLRNGIKKS
jgi:MtfA peptidase